MAAPVYFFPGVKKKAFAAGNKPNQSLLRERGLDSVLGELADLDRQTCCNDLPGTGPGGASGLMLSVAPLAGRELGSRVTGYHPELQAWHHVVDAGDVQLWIGLDKEEPV